MKASVVTPNYNGKEFIMTDVFFSDEMKKVQDSLIVELDKKSVGERIMVVYTDIFGNDLTECFSV